MIRRRIGSEWWLFTQDDHARLAHALAVRVGNEQFAAPQPSGPVLTGIALHDAGWPAHDRQPTLNPAGEPLDVFEVPREIALPIWTECAHRAAAADPYAGLLTSLHVLALSAYAARLDASRADQPEVQPPHTRFAMLQFQQNQIELQQALRDRLGLPTDRPLTHGLDLESTDPHEQKLISDFRLLQAMDQLSLNLCCTTPPAPTLHLPPHPGAPSVELKFQRLDEDHAQVDPWPFDRAEFQVAIPSRRLPAIPFSDTESFRTAYDRIKARPLALTLCRSA